MGQCRPRRPKRPGPPEVLDGGGFFSRCCLEDVNQFRFNPSSPDASHHCIKDHDGNTLAYRFRLPQSHLDSLIESSQHLPQPTSLLTSNTRGSFQSRIYTIWADYSKTLMQSANYQRQLPQSEAFLSANRPLFNYLSNNLRLLDPEMYCKFTSIDPYLPAGFTHMAGAWHGLAMNQNMVSGGHQSYTPQDWQDYICGYNCCTMEHIFWRKLDFVAMPCCL